MISLSLSDFILNIQDDNTSFQEEYWQLIQKGDYVVKVFKGYSRLSLKKESRIRC